MKYILILVLCDKFGMPMDSLTATTVESKAACERAAKQVKRETSFIRPICVSRTEQ